MLRIEKSNNFGLLSRAGGGIWPDETQQPTVIPLQDGAPALYGEPLIKFSAWHGANSGETFCFAKIRGAENDHSEPLFLYEKRLFLFVKNFPGGTKNERTSKTYIRTVKRTDSP